MKVLIACEFSGKVRDAFLDKGHNAFSCDLLPCESDRADGRHFQEDIVDLLKREPAETWDLIIAHPPCDHLAVSGARWFKEKKADGRQQAGIDFFLFFIGLSCPRICVENPIGIMSTHYRTPDQIVHPWQFGDPFEKKTCLWLQGLDPLVPTDIVVPEKRHVTKSGKSLPTWYNLPPSPDRAKKRSITFDGIAKAMAEQWG